MTFPQPADFPPIWADAWGDDGYGLWAEFVVGVEQQRLRWIAPGEFWMGSPEEEGGDSDEWPRHRVRHTRGFWLADTVCTQALWLAVVRGDSPGSYVGDGQGPVEQVSWYDVQAFLQELTKQLGGGVVADLPTEAQWEYACRAGSETAFAFGTAVVPAQVNYGRSYRYGAAPPGESRVRTLAVKALPANAWGLHQMHGNVCEWCADGTREYAADSGEVIDDPRGPDEHGESAMRALRGGSWIDSARNARSACRGRARLGDGLSFRLALRSSSETAAGKLLERL